jgi:LssY C-terminus
MKHRRRRLLRRIAWIALTLLGLYLLVAYVVLPRLWMHYEHEPGLEGRPMVTVTADGIPGDPLNVGLVGSKEEAIRALLAAGWYPADAVTLKTSIEIVGSVLFDRPFRDAPVSPLFYEGKKQAFAFEKPVGNSADRRNHVRFFETLGEWRAGRPVWLGSATYDRGVGISHYTGEITHHIGPDIDAERNLLMRELAAARMLTEIYDVTGVGPTLFGRNGGGDPYYTDGELRIGVVSPGAVPADEPPRVLPDPPIVAAKDALFASAKELVGQDSPPQH